MAGLGLLLAAAIAEMRVAPPDPESAAFLRDVMLRRDRATHAANDTPSNTGYSVSPSCLAVAQKFWERLEKPLNTGCVDGKGVQSAGCSPHAVLTICCV